MAGSLGKAMSVAGVAVEVALIPESVYTTISIRCLHAAATPLNAYVTIYIGVGATPSKMDAWMWKYQMGGGTAFDETFIVCSSGEKVWIESDSNDIVCQVRGVEKIS